MTEEKKRYYISSVGGKWCLYDREKVEEMDVGGCIVRDIFCYDPAEIKQKWDEVVDLLNEQEEYIEELQISDEMGWKRAEKFEKKCPKELHNKEMYIKRLEYKVEYYKKRVKDLIDKEMI